MFLQQFNTDFETIGTKVREITDTENTFCIEPNSSDYEKALKFENYSSYGLKTLGSYVGFPAQFVTDLAATNVELAEDVIKDRVDNYFYNQRKMALYGREFLGSIQGVVSNKYAYFDDNEVIDVLGQSSLKNLEFKNTIITPERLHLRAIENEPFKIDGDDSNLFFVFFIDNSMVGQSSFRVRLGIFRQTCENGLIINRQEFVICKQIHRGIRDISDEFNASLEFLSSKKEIIMNLVAKSATEKAKIENLQAEFKQDYLAKKLNLNQKESAKIIMLYQDTYGGNTKWAMTNAITEFARDIPDINRRVFLEGKALLVA